MRKSIIFDFEREKRLEREEIMQEGMQQGIAYAQNDYIVRMFKSGMTSSNISNILDIDLTTVNKIIRGSKRKTLQYA